MREPLTDFFTQALRRNIAERFDNAEEMLREWRDCFAGLEEPGPLSDHADESKLRDLLADATFDSQIPELSLGTRATNALDRANVLTVEDLLTVSMYSLNRLRGVGQKTRREIAVAVKILRERLGKPDREQPLVPETVTAETEVVDVGNLSVDLLADRILKTGSREGETTQTVSRRLLGLEAVTGEAQAVSDQRGDYVVGRGGIVWPSQSDVARHVDVTRGRVGQIVGKLQGRWAKDAAISRARSDLADMLSGQAGIMSARELSEALLVARGSSQDDPLRTQLSRAVVRAAVEVERTMAEPRFIVRRDKDCVLIARNADLANYARRVGEVGDQIADEDPLLAPSRVVERLREIPAPADLSIPDARLVRLAAEVSDHAAVSSRQELYPHGLAAARALKLSQGALLGQRMLTVEQIRDRVSGRYPEASPLPDRTELDDLLHEAGFDLRWDPSGRDGVGCYVSPLRELVSVTSGSGSVPRLPTAPGRGEAGEITPEEADARQFEERLQRSISEGAFLALLVHPKYYDRARRELCRRFPLQLVDFEGMFLEALQETADDAKVKWDLVLQTDTKPHEGDWDKLMMLIGRTMPAVEKRLLAAEKTMLVVYAGLLARYDQMELLSQLSQKVGRSGGIPGLWLLLPGDKQALIDGKPVPLVGPGQRTRIPESWIGNVHRGNGNGEVP